MSKFKVGDVCVIVDGPRWAPDSTMRHVIGRECTIRKIPSPDDPDIEKGHSSIKLNIWGAVVALFAATAAAIWGAVVFVSGPIEKNAENVSALAERIAKLEARQEMQGELLHEARDQIAEQSRREEPRAKK